MFPLNLSGRSTVDLDMESPNRAVEIVITANRRSRAVAGPIERGSQPALDPALNVRPIETENRVDDLAARTLDIHRHAVQLSSSGKLAQNVSDRTASVSVAVEDTGDGQLLPPEPIPAKPAS